MFKKFASVLGTFTLICFSFYYTDSAIDVIKKTDPIMQQIIEYSSEYGNTSIDSTLVNNNIIPGIKGTIVDIDESYNKMKRLGKFDTSLIVFQEVNPEISIINNYENYIISGNNQKNNISLIFVLEDSSFIEEILSILNKKDIKVTFFIDDDLFNDAIDLLKLILLSGHKVEFYDEKYETAAIKKYNNILKSITNDNLNYCYTTIKNDNLLENCKKEKLHTIIPTIITDFYPYNDIKNNIENGSIISLKNNKNTARELSSIINYILQKGKKIVTLEKLLEE